MKKLIFKVTGKIWLYPSDYARWHFVTIPKKESLEISKYYSELKKAWGSLPVTVTLGKTTWETSIFPDRKSDTYILPLKSLVRKDEGVTEGDAITFKFFIKS